MWSIGEGVQRPFCASFCLFYLNNFEKNKTKKQKTKIEFMKTGTLDFLLSTRFFFQLTIVPHNFISSLKLNREKYHLKKKICLILFYSQQQHTHTKEERKKKLNQNIPS
jgi:hypothetical protein